MLKVALSTITLTLNPIVAHLIKFNVFSLFTGKAETVITADEAVRGGKLIPLKEVVDNAVKLSNCIKRVFVYKRTGNDVPMTNIDFDIEKVCVNKKPSKNILLTKLI